MNRGILKMWAIKITWVTWRSPLITHGCDKFPLHIKMVFKKISMGCVEGFPKALQHNVHIATPIRRFQKLFSRKGACLQYYFALTKLHLRDFSFFQLLFILIQPLCF